MSLLIKNNIFYFLILIILFSSCSSHKEQKALTISTNSWIGYAPLFYAKEKGYLDKLNIKLNTNVSLAEASNAYVSGQADMFTATQHGYNTVKKVLKDTVAVMLLDRSDGGDVILSNKSITALKNATKIDAYLEIDSINKEILLDFIKHNKINKSKLHFINKDQSQIHDLRADDAKFMLVVSYFPYNIKLQKHGFKEIASTKNINDIVVIDALYTSKKLLKQENNRLKRLKDVIDQSIIEIESNKKDSYKLIKNYLDNISYNEYINSLKLIEWIHKPSSVLLKRIQPMGYDEKFLIK